jgi:hypothetical protein
MIVLGFVLLALPFVAAIVFTAVVGGWRVAAAAWGLAAVVTAVFVAGAYLVAQ